MSISLKSRGEVSLILEAGRILTLAMEEMRKAIVPGITTYEIDKIGEQTMRDLGGVPACIGYGGFPAAVCVSVNEEVVHGIPSRYKELKDGDIVSLDTVTAYQGYHADAARTYAVGRISAEKEKLIRVTKESFFEGLKQCVPGRRIGDISRAVFDHIVKNGFSANRYYTGHGIGEEMHEAPNVPNFPKFFKGPKLRPGMVICIEPMVNMGDHEVELLDDDWTAVTADGSLAAHYENTVLITRDKPVILTKAQGIEI